MIFQDKSDAIAQLIAKLKDESLPSHTQITALTPEGELFAKPIATQLNFPYFFLPNLIASKLLILNSKLLIIIDDGQVRVGEYPEFIDQLRLSQPSLEIIIAVPVIPQNEELQFKQLGDRLITLSIEPLFFSIDQFYDISTR